MTRIDIGIESAPVFDSGEHILYMKRIELFGRITFVTGIYFLGVLYVFHHFSIKIELGITVAGGYE